MNIQDEQRNDLKYMLGEIKNDASLFQCASDKLKHNKDFIFKALFSNLDTFKYIPDDLKNNKKFMIHATMHFGIYPFKFASDELKKNKQFLRCVSKIIVTKFPFSFREFSDMMEYNKDVIIKTIKIYPSCIQYLSDKYLNDSNFMKQVFAVNPSALLYMPKKEFLENAKNILSDITKKKDNEPVIVASRAK